MEAFLDRETAELRVKKVRARLDGAYYQHEELIEEFKREGIEFTITGKKRVDAAMDPGFIGVFVEALDADDGVGASTDGEGIRELSFEEA